MTKDQAVNHFGSIAALAERLRVSYQAVHRWSVVPALRQLQLEKMTGGTLVADLIAAPEAPPTMTQTIPATSHQRSSTGGAVNLSSTANSAV